MVSEANRERTRERMRERTAKPLALASPFACYARVTSRDSSKWRGTYSHFFIETFRFEDENDYDFDILFKVFSRIVKK